jgi:hypothetical protein
MSKQFEQAGLAFKKQAECYMQLQSKHEAASAWQAAATAYQKVSFNEKRYGKKHKLAKMPT